MLNKKIKTLLTILLFILLFSCGKKDSDMPDSNMIQNETIEKEIPSDNSIPETTKDTVTAESKIKTEKASITKSDVKPKIKEVSIPANFKIYRNLKSLLSSMKIGESKSKDELIASGNVPNDALKIVKSVTKVSENELSVKWKSTWLVEKVSDVKLNDDKIKIKFKNDLVYTSGNAIGIKYDGKIYNDLIIKGDRAYIPTVKQYTWKIGKK